MKKRVWILILCLMMGVGCAKAAPELSGVFAGDASLISGQEGWYIEFSATEGGRLALQLLSGETGEFVADVGAKAIDAGSGRIGWNGLLADGTPVPAGNYMLTVQLKNYWNEESTPSVLS
ncbi:MAG: FlgD immunoglobulin-like domain containing protein, partial [Eubacteriales bacterium]|nr:FlgD immunoglobulin-like domain containing protein [Eubacteriales bacterium]